MEQIKKGSPEYFLIDKEYKEVIKNITREESYNKFIGGLPVTLERKDLFTIVSKDKDQYRYSITQKVDGTRMLLFAGYKESSGNRKIVFIDRSNNYFIPKNLDRANLPNFNGPRLLIDGEILVFDKNNKISENLYLRSENVSSFSFMAFDILYGPISIEYKGLPNQQKLLIGSEGAFSGPKGGKMWNYKKRYDILYLLIVPHELNNYRPPLTMNFLSTNWFTIEIKPIYMIDTLKTVKNIYTVDNNQGFFNSSLINFRREFYESLNKLQEEKGEKKNVLISDIQLDGLIFTPFNTEYVIGGPWKKFLNVQYKWKPIEQQSIDFAIFKENGKILLKVRKGDNLITFTDKIGDKILPSKVKLTDKLNKVKNETIGEFTFNNKTKEFELLRLRIDKDSPNSLSTALNVRNAINKPVDLNIIKKFFIINKLNVTGLQSLLKNMTKPQLLRCSISNNLNLINEENKNNIYSLMNEFYNNDNYELEIRLGFIEPERFQTNLPANLYKQILDILSSKNFNWNFTIFKDIFKDGLRSRYIYLKNFNSFVHQATIEKESLNKIDIDTKFIYNIDMRYSLSNEKIIKDISKIKISEEDGDLVLIKKRYSFNLEFLNIDCTEISKLDILTQKETTNNYQVEFELTDRTKDTKNYLFEINNLLRDILNNINN